MSERPPDGPTEAHVLRRRRDVSVQDSGGPGAITLSPDTEMEMGKAKEPITLHKTLLPRLPPYSGDHAVGTVDLEIPARSPRSFAGLKMTTGEDALRLDTVLMTIYYPREDDVKGKGRGQHWCSKPIGDAATGYAKFAATKRFYVRLAITFLFAAHTRIPARMNAPIKRGLPPKPLILFSHGLGGNRTTYSVWCGEMASRGYVVAAIEHRDGSGPSSWINRSDGSSRHVLWMTENDISPETRRPAMEMRTDELELRVAEMEEAEDVVKRIVKGDGEQVSRENTRTRGTKGFLDPGKDQIDWSGWKGVCSFDKGTIWSGHSFGGATVLRALQTVERSRINKALLLDPWVEPVPTMESRTSIPVFAMINPGFTRWKANFNRMRSIFSRLDGPNWLGTLGGTVHLSFSDFPLIYPRIMRMGSKLTADPLRAMRLIVDGCIEFLNGAPGPVLSTPEHPGSQDDLSEPCKLYVWQKSHL